MFYTSSIPLKKYIHIKRKETKLKILENNSIVIGAAQLSVSTQQNEHASMNGIIFIIIFRLFNLSYLVNKRSGTGRRAAIKFTSHTARARARVLAHNVMNGMVMLKQQRLIVTRNFSKGGLNVLKENYLKKNGTRAS